MIRYPKLSTTLVAALTLVSASSALARDRFPLELTILSEEGRGIEGVTVNVNATSGEPYSFRGITDKKGRFKADLPDFDRAYQVHAEKPGLAPIDQPLDLAAAQIKIGQTAEVRLTMAPPTAAYYYAKGREALLAEELDRAIELMAEAVAFDPAFFPGWKALSGLYLAVSRPADAVAAADAALALSEADEIVLRNRVDALSLLGRSEDLDEALEALIARAPSKDTAVLAFNRGVEALKGKDVGAARRWFLQALDIAPELHQAHSALAELAIGEAESLEGEARDAKLVEALAALDAAIAAAPRNFKALERKAQILGAMGRTDEAAEVERTIAELRSGG